MILNKISSLKEKLNLEDTKSVCIIDNNFMSFLVELKKEIDISYIFLNYDFILIPKWVYVEISDSEYRKSCLEEISIYKDVYIVDELEYSELYVYKDYSLVMLFIASIHLMARERGKLTQVIKKQGEEIDPNIFIDELYNNILVSEGNMTKSGRLKRKNAGEISICVLSHIIRYNYTNIDNIVIFSFDSDCYDFVQNSKEILYSKKSIFFDEENYFKGQRKISATFKSNDFILKEMYDLGKDNNMEIIDKVRKNERYVKYTRKKTDGSIEEEKEYMNTEDFKIFIKKDNVHLIF